MMLLKIGGGAAIDIAAVAEDVARIDEPMVIVHGANAIRDELAEQLGVDIERVTSISGFTSVLTNEDTIDLMMMAYSGLRNKRLVERLHRRGVNAIGLSGIDGGLIRARRNRGIRVQVEGRKMMLRDLSGKPQSVNVDLLQSLLDQGYTPVLCPPILDEEGFAVNTENDEIIALLQSALHADRVVQLIEAPGLLRDVKDESSMIETMSHEDLAEWEERVEGRMKRKLRALRKLGEAGRPTVHLGDGRVAEPVTRLLNGAGTRIQ